MEGHFDSHPHGAPLVLFGIPDPARHRMDHAIEVPKLSSLILKHDLNAPLAGLDAFPANRVPPVSILFWSFRIMVGLGFAMLGLGLWSLWARWRGTLFENRWLQRAAILMGPSGFVAVLAGWVTTEVGRQPWTVYGHLLTAQSHSPLAAPAVAASLTAFVLVYFAAFGAGTWYILRLMARARPTRASQSPLMPVRAAGITPAPASMPTGRRWKCTHELRPRPTAWACVIAFAIFAYVVMDGFDLGIGILFPTLKVGPSGMRR
jgi:cytochrome d ubiquinol oxidase subunit I